ncbi:MAG: hypothetical protein ACO24H_03350 [Polynucleobacter sp.]
MSVSPGQYNISLQRRSSFYLRLQFKGESDVPIDLTGWAVYVQAWDKKRTVKYVDFSVEYVDRVLGIINIRLTDEQTAALPCESFYDVMLDSGDGTKEYYLEGMIFASEGYTSPVM